MNRPATAAGRSKLDPFRDEIDRLLRSEPRLPGKRIRELIEELGYAGGKTILDDYLRELRPRYLPRRTYQRTLYRPGELMEFDLFEPREPISVGHGQTRRGLVATAELCWSRALATCCPAAAAPAARPTPHPPPPRRPSPPAHRDQQSS